MSYILDALKRAEAERGQGGSSAFADPSATGGDRPLISTAPPKRNALVWGGSIAAMALIVGATAVAWQRWGDPAPIAPETSTLQPTEKMVADVAADPARPAPLATEALPSAQIDAATSAPVPAPAPPRAPVLPILAKAPPAPPPPAPAPPPQNAESRAPEPAPDGSTPAVAPRAAPPPETATNAAPPALSATARAALPDIVVSGSSYSANREHRMLIANGQVVKEGQALTPDLTLEVIGPHSAVFNHRGTRFNVNY